MLIAVTQSDETNLVACKVAANLFNMPTRIARVRSRSILAHPELLTDDGFAVDYAISPEDIVTEYIIRLIEFPEALQVLRFRRRPGHDGGGARGRRRSAGGPPARRT